MKAPRIIIVRAKSELTITIIMSSHARPIKNQKEQRTLNRIEDMIHQAQEAGLTNEFSVEVTA